MAVQKSRKSKSKRDSRRAQNSSIEVPTLSIEKTTGETHRRHHISAEGYYRGRQVIIKRRKEEAKDEG